MSSRADHKAVMRSQKLFEHLLAAYPKAHREEYGAAMAQLFRDQCRDAWRESRGWGLVKLWVRVLPDVVKTSIGEHLANLRGRGSIMKNLAVILRSKSVPLAVFAMVFVLVFVTVAGTSAVVTFLLPKMYSSMARIKEQPGAGVASSGLPDPYFVQTELEVIQSELILNKVIAALNLNQAWDKKFNADGPLKTSESRALLKRMIEVRPTKGTSLIEIRAYSDEPKEAAQIANTVAKVYQEHRETEAALLSKAGTEEALRSGVAAPPPSFLQVVIINAAEPNQRAVRPNVPLNLALGGVGGMLAALVAGGIAVGIVLVLKRRMVAQPR